jgi:hypothetical protein
MIKYEFWNKIDAPDSELLSFNFLAPPYLGKPKKGTSFTENHEYNVLVVLSSIIVGSVYIGLVGNSSNFVLLVGNYGKRNSWISYKYCT